jgi:hypothetical protein
LLEKHEIARQKAETKQKTLDKIKDTVSKKIESGDFHPADAVLHTIIGQVTPPVLSSPVEIKTLPNPEQSSKQPPLSKAVPSTLTPPVDSKQQRPRVVSLDKVNEIIRRYAKSEVANLLIAKIEEETK